jgi:hypothetical protein
MNVRVSLFARWYVRRRGGELYVWVGSLPGKSGSGLLRSSTRHRPPDVKFERLELGVPTLWFEQGLVIDDVEIGWSPFTGIDITWPGTIPST